MVVKNSFLGFIVITRRIFVSCDLINLLSRLKKTVREGVTIDPLEIDNY